MLQTNENSAISLSWRGQKSVVSVVTVIVTLFNKKLFSEENCCVVSFPKFHYNDLLPTTWRLPRLRGNVCNGFWALCSAETPSAVTAAWKRHHQFVLLRGLLYTTCLSQQLMCTISQVSGELIFQFQTWHAYMSSCLSLTCHPDFLQPTCCTAVQPVFSQQTGFSGFRRQLLEQSSVPSHVISALSLAIFRQRPRTFLFRLLYPDLVIWFAYSFVQL